ncbi:MAG: acyl carrier protein [Clostridia bacterium]|nr:acyl carrier protein [Clostridia bacterium]
MDFKNILKKAGDVAKKVDKEDVKELLDGVDTEEIKAIVTKFIQAKKEDVKLEGDTNLFENGFVNSLFALDIVTFLEKTFKIRLGKNDINKDNLSTVNKIVALVERLKK